MVLPGVHAPQIWVDKKGNFMTESPYYKEVARQSFALKYVGVSNEPYPIKYLGYFGTKKEPVIQFVDTVKTFRLSESSTRKSLPTRPPRERRSSWG